MKKFLEDDLAYVLIAVLLMAGLLYSADRLAEAAGTEPPGMAADLRDGIRSPSTYVNALVLAANTAETLTAPTFAAYPSAKVIGVFSPTCSNWYYNSTAVAAVPAADVTDGGAAARAPTALKMTQAGTVSIVADAACTITIEWYIAKEPA